MVSCFFFLKLINPTNGLTLVNLGTDLGQPNGPSGLVELLQESHLVTVALLLFCRALHITELSCTMATAGVMGWMAWDAWKEGLDAGLEYISAYIYNTY